MQTPRLLRLSLLCERWHAVFFLRRIFDSYCPKLSKFRSCLQTRWGRIARRHSGCQNKRVGTRCCCADAVAYQNFRENTAMIRQWLSIRLGRCVFGIWFWRRSIGKSQIKLHHELELSTEKLRSKSGPISHGSMTTRWSRVQGNMMEWSSSFGRCVGADLNDWEQ